MTSISVVIMANNEEEFIERCIKSSMWADEILVVDSGSTDRTKEIAASLGATVYEQKWLGSFGAQRHKAIELAKNDWIFWLESDEIISEELKNSIRALTTKKMSDEVGYSVRRLGDFYGILLPNLRIRNKRLLRFFNRRYANYKPTANPHMQIKLAGRIIPLDGDLIHWRAFAMNGYIDSANKLADIEAKILYERGIRASGLKIFLIPVLRFLWTYCICAEFRLGSRGLVHSMLEATREFIRYTKLWELEAAPRVPHPPTSVYSSPTDETIGAISTKS